MEYAQDHERLKYFPVSEINAATPTYNLGNNALMEFLGFKTPPTPSVY